MPCSVPVFPVAAIKQIVIVSVLQVKPGLEKPVLDELRALIHKSREEAGCLLFDLYRRAGDSSQIFLHEAWESRDAQEAHATNPHTSRFRVGVNRCLEHPIEAFEVEEIA